MEKYNEIIKLLDEKINKIDKNELISYPEKSYMMFLVIKEMEKNYKSIEDLLIFHQALRNWMCEHVAMIWWEELIMKKYEIFDYDVWGNEEDGYEVNDVVPTGITIYIDTSKASICKKLGLDDPYKVEVDYNEDVIYIDYDGNPYCELRKKD